jgi:hypothetical protein
MNITRVRRSFLRAGIGIQGTAHLASFFYPDCMVMPSIKFSYVQMCEIPGKQTSFTVGLVLPQKHNVCGCIYLKRCALVLKLW